MCIEHIQQIRICIWISWIIYHYHIHICILANMKYRISKSEYEIGYNTDYPYSFAPLDRTLNILNFFFKCKKSFVVSFSAPVGHSLDILVDGCLRVLMLSYGTINLLMCVLKY